MKTLYVSQQGCYVKVQEEMLLIEREKTILTEIQLPLLEQIFIFGKSLVSTQAIRACLWRNIPIAYLSRMGYCYGRIFPIERGYRHLSRHQQQLSPSDRLSVAREIVRGKLKNSRVLLRRQQKNRRSQHIARVLDTLDYLAEQADSADSLERLMGFEGAGAAQYFSAFGECFVHPGFAFIARTRRPPGNPVNAMLSFGYQVLWNHIFSLIEIQGLDPYYACLHQGTERHAALASDLIEEFRAPLVDSLVLWLVNSRVMDAQTDFVYRDGGCYLNESGRPKFLKAFLQKMEESVQTQTGEKQPRWDLLTQQVKAYKQFICDRSEVYKPYRIR